MLGYADGPYDRGGVIFISVILTLIVGLSYHGCQVRKGYQRAADRICLESVWEEDCRGVVHSQDETVCTMKHKCLKWAPEKE